MNKIEQMCLMCGHTPCICGTQYKSASVKELINGLLMIKSELGDRGYDINTITVNGEDALETYLSLCGVHTAVFDEETINKLTNNKNIPNQWVVRVLSARNISDLLTSFNHANEDICPLLAMAYYFVLVHLSSNLEKCIYSEFATYIAKSVFQHGTFNRNVIDKSPVKTGEQIAYLHTVIQDCESIEYKPEGYKDLKNFYNWIYCEHDESLQNPIARFNRFFLFIASLCGIEDIKSESDQFINISKYTDELFYMDESLLDTIKLHPVFKKPEIQHISVR